MSKATLEHAARYDDAPKVRIAAIQQLDPEKSKATLEHAARYDEDARVREAAVRQLKA